MLEETAARLLPMLKSLPAAMLPLLARPHGRPPVGDTPEEVLASPRRRAIFRLTEKEPGITSLAIQQRLDIGAGVFFHHLHKLISSGLVTKQYGGNATYLYPSETAPPLEPPALAHATANDVARIVLAKPGISSRELSEALERPLRTIGFHLKKLVDAGYVEQQKGGNAPTYQPTAKLREELSRN
jgi:predicted transcriptional regulator